MATYASWWYSFFRENPGAAWEAQHLAQVLGVNHYDLFGPMFLLTGIAEQRILDPPGLDIRFFQSAALSTVTGIEMGVDEVWQLASVSGTRAGQ